MKGFLAIIIILLSFVQVNADSIPQRHWYVPSRASLQFAGNIGFLAAGTGITVANEKIDLDLFYGFVPEKLGGPLHSITLKPTWIPLHKYQLSPRLEADFLTIGLPVTYTVGGGFFFLAPKDQYPSHYYDYSEACRIGISAGGRLHLNTAGGGCLKQITGYYEIGTYDLMIHNFYYTAGTTRFTDLFNLGLGIQFHFGR